ncbi:ABC transporter permease [Dinghuibacter silviterrae]|uniref:Putative ABC transport system permease protein n=1 Tax=Dinghuibacter silviterrae TaxID=1539049 RepID=A0A4R8DRG1_9BACT|nr:ABC transporter permease [Dinghuibacter silviterrae]TDW99720.1 putative ABC transport system permease protein [Dinghuibacter silviterrae]
MMHVYLKLAWRNFWKNRRYTLINMAGLSIALTLFLLALLYRNSEVRYERWNPGHENVYRIGLRDDGGDVALTPRPFATAVRELPVAQAATTVTDYWRSELLITTADKKIFDKNAIRADSSFLDVFEYPLLYGDAAKALKEPHTVLLTRSLSELLFGKGVNPVGLSVTMGEFGLCKVTGVIDKDRYPSHLPFSCVIQLGLRPVEDWTSNNTYVYVRCKPHTQPLAYEPLLNRTYASLALETAGLHYGLSSAEMAELQENIASRKYFFTPVDPLHLDSRLRYEWPGNGTGGYLRSLYLIVLIIMVMAAINFTNLSVAYAARRAKETGLRKVVGAARGQLVLQFLAETFFQCLLALFLALVVAELFLPLINAHLGLTIRGWIGQDTLPLLGQLFLSTLITTLMAGLYPAFVMSGYLPALVLKGSFSTGTRGVLLRRILLITQFTCASVFISGIFVIVRQIDYMRHMDLGYQANQVLAVQIHDEHTNSNFASIRSRLEAVPGISAVSRTSQIQGEDLGNNTYGYHGKAFSVDFLAVDAGYCAAMGLPLVQGREFDGLHQRDTFNAVYVNEAFARQAGVTVGDFLNQGNRKIEVIGIVKDFRAGSPQAAITPLLFQLLRGNTPNYVLLQLDSRQAQATIDRLETVWPAVEPGYPCQYTFLDDHFAHLLRDQERFSFLVSIFSTMALVLAVMGVVALAAYTAERKVKEITIRKVLGASVPQILALLNKDFVRWVLTANILAIPLSGLLLHRWLQDFAYRIHLGPVPFVLAFLGSLGITVLVVTLQSLKASLASPAKALKYE